MATEKRDRALEGKVGGLGPVGVARRLREPVPGPRVALDDDVAASLSAYATTSSLRPHHAWNTTTPGVPGLASPAAYARDVTPPASIVSNTPATSSASAPGAVYGAEWFRRTDPLMGRRLCRRHRRYSNGDAFALLADAFGHHIWATIRVLDACAALDDAQLATTVPGTYGSIIDTLRHLVGGDVFYLDVMRGGEPEPFREEEGDIPTMRAVMEAHDAAWQRLVASDIDPTTDVIECEDSGYQTRAARDPSRPGAPPWNRPSQPGLHRAHDPRHRAAGDRPVGLRRPGRPRVHRTDRSGRTVLLSHRLNPSRDPRTYHSWSPQSRAFGTTRLRR
jgi:hypothetical protein